MQIRCGLLTTIAGFILAVEKSRYIYAKGDYDMIEKKPDQNENGSLPIDKKLNLTIREAAEYSNIGVCKLAEILRNPLCDFVVYVGHRKLVKRREFEEYLSTRREI